MCCGIGHLVHDTVLEGVALANSLKAACREVLASKKNGTIWEMFADVFKGREGRW